MLFLLAYNELIDARHERAEIAMREDQFIDRQQKLIDTQAGRIANLEKRIGPGSSGETPSPQVSKDAASAAHLA